MPTARSVRRATAVVLTALTTLAAGLVAAPAEAANRVTPGNFTGYGFDQCHTPSQEAMDAWLTSSPYWAVGIYISGDSRFCRDQPNLTAEWVDTQLRHGWRLLPITVGPQAWCTTRDRYKKQVRIHPDPADDYAEARRQGRVEARKTVRAAQDLGIARHSTLWYDLEHFDITRNRCRESALSFLHAWTNMLHKKGYRSGVYSSASSGIRMLDDARVAGRYRMPDRVWIGDWNGEADVYSSYIREDGWLPGGRVHQFRGGHDERHGGVTINIDSNYMDLGRGSDSLRDFRHCGGIELNFDDYRAIGPRSKGPLVRAAKCLLHEQDYYGGPMGPHFNRRMQRAVQRFRADHDMVAHRAVSRRTWMFLVTRGPTPLVKIGSARPAVRRLERALNAADAAGVTVDGVFRHDTTRAVKRYQRDHGLPRTGVVTDEVWDLLTAARR